MSEADAEDDTPLVLDKPQKTEMSETIFIPVFFDARIPHSGSSCGQKQNRYLKNFKKNQPRFCENYFPKKRFRKTESAFSFRVSFKFLLK